MTVGILVLAAAMSLQGGVEAPLERGAALSFDARALDGKVVLSKALRGRASLIMLWGTWSEQSSRVLEIAQRMHEAYGGRGLQVVGLASWDTLESVRAFREGNPQLKFDLWWDPAGKDTAGSLAVKVFKTRRFPSVYLLDGALRVVEAIPSFKKSDMPGLEKAIQGALGAI